MELQQCAAVLLNAQFNRMEKWEDKESRKDIKVRRCRR